MDIDAGLKDVSKQADEVVAALDGGTLTRAAVRDLAKAAWWAAGVALKAHARLTHKSEPTFGPMAQGPDGTLRLAIVEDPMRIGQGIARVFASMLDGGPGNYIEMPFHRGDSDERILVTVQRVGRLTPHFARKEAEQHLARAVALLQEHGITWDGPTTFEPDKPVPTPREEEAATRWCKIDVSTTPNEAYCERCGGRQVLPERVTAGMMKAMCDAFGEAHADCQEGDADVVEVRP